MIKINTIYLIPILKNHITTIIVNHKSFVYIFNLLSKKNSEGKNN